MSRWLAMLALASFLSGSSRAEPETGCFATDYAPESIAMVAQPLRGSKRVRSLSREDLASFTNVDAVSTPREGWLELRNGCSTGWVSDRDVACRLTPDAARSAISGEAALVISALKERRMAELARHVHPAKGLRFSPYATVDPKSDKIVMPGELPGALTSAQPRVWGAEDGSGRSIRLSFAKYYQKFVYDRDFARAPETTFNAADDGSAKAWEAYPSGIVVAYHFPDEGESAATTLRLVFERHHGKWFLSGVIHDGWTI